ncbi:DUF4136 domain-containing protein [Paludibaculum fermentans]|uniref:DUF4136 domain-containing protein n=1 Tax=Paludibaculum fermentans TaxID=1473598 RepID=UPI003EBAB609
MKLTLSGTLTLAAAFVGIAFAARVSTDFDHTVHFDRYKTYSWMKVDAKDSLWEDRIVRSVDNELTAKGWKKVDSGGDATVAAFGSTHKERTLDTFYSGFGGGWRWRGFGDGMATTTVEYTQVGTLVVDVFDAQTRKLVWRGSSSATLSGKAEKNEKKLQKDVGEMFKHFPPEARLQSER